jgi:hypothetical protein
MLGTTLTTVVNLLNTAPDLSPTERAMILGTLTATGLLTPTGGASTSSVPIDLQSLVNAIPIAEDGHVITSLHHNSLRAALLAIVTQLGGEPVSGTVTLTFLPSFLPSGSQPPWLLAEGVATRSAGASAARGWFPLQLPEGARLQNMTGIGRRTGTVASFQLQLQRQPINDTPTTVLISIPLQNAGDPFQVTGSVQVAGAGPAALEEYRLINNSAFKYLVMASLVGADTAAEAQIFAIRVAYSR